MDFASDRFEPASLTWIEVRDSLRLHWRLAAAVLLATVLGCYVTLQFVTEQYESEASLLVKVGRENTELPASVENGAFISAGVRKEEVNSEIRLLTSRSQIESVVDAIGPAAFSFQPVRPQGLFKLTRYYVKSGLRWIKEQGRETLVLLNLERDLSQREKAIIAVQKALTVENEKDSDVITVRLHLPSPELAVRTATALLSGYLERRPRVIETPHVEEFFAAEVRAKRVQVDKLLQEREQVRSEWNLTSIPDQRQLLLKQASDLESEIDANGSEIAMLARQQEVMKIRLEQLPTTTPSSQTVAPNPTVLTLKERITALQVERAKLASRYTVEAEPLKKVDEEIADLRQQTKEEEPTVLASSVSEIMPVRKDFDNSLESNGVKIEGLRAKNRNLELYLGTLRRQLAKLNVGEDRLASVERELTLAQQSYMNYATRSEQARISEQLDSERIANVSILSPASWPIEPFYPRKITLMLIAIVAGLVLATGLTLLIDYFDDTIRDAGDLARLDGIPVLGRFKIATTGQAG